MSCQIDYQSDCPITCLTLTNTYSVFIMLVLVLVFLWVIASFATIALDNLFYRTLDFDITKTSDTFCVTVCIFLIFIFITYLIKYLGVIPNLEQRILGVGGNERKIKGPNYSKFIDLSENLELQGGGIVNNDFLSTLRAERLAKGI